MKPNVSLIATLKRVKSESGPDLFEGTLEYSALRKIKAVDIELILVPIESAPGPLAEIIAAGAVDRDGLMVFAGPAPKEGGASRKKHE
ncbi:MAG: hypothetical protein NTW86_15550 [Candidatus Sumerlaeota bacterium]|nr:hypothetical protein [Candidatus Sumerlaeota bacterium]